jgi:6-phosphogluconolactonase (cycloisomerase 2 family)
LTRAGSALTGIGSVPRRTSPYYLAVDITGRFVHAANDGSANVSMYVVDLNTGELVPNGTIAAGTLSRSITIVSF